MMPTHEQKPTSRQSRASHRWRRVSLLALLIVPLSYLVPVQAADEFSSGDKLRTLYSNHFAFTDDGLPQVTIEIMGGQREVSLEGKDLVAMPDGEGGAQFSGVGNWTLRVEDSRPARMQEWIVVARFDSDNNLDAEVEVAKWRQSGHKVKTFEIGTIFAVQGKVLDTRKTLIGIDPVAPGKGLAKSRQISEDHKVKATFHTELLRRPSGTIVATSGDLEIRNPSVIWFATENEKSTITVNNVVVGGGGSQLGKSKARDRRYLGSVYVTVGSDGKLTVANAVASDDLLSGLVPSEMFPDAPMEALKAQSVAARTELLQKLGVRHLGDPFLLCATQHCQVYSGAGHEHPRTNKAVRATRGQVLVNAKHELVDARYSATCGGHSEHNEVVWGGEADSNLRGHYDGPKSSQWNKGVNERSVASFLKQEGGYCSKTKYSKGRFRWKVSAEAKLLERRIATKYSRIGNLLRIEPIKRGVSGRITLLRLVGSQKSLKVEGELTIRRLLGGLRSSLFTVKPVGPSSRPTSFEFRGAGFGHGVGMCQLGAIGMASEKRQVGEILGHYYLHSRLQRLY